jgi:D-mannonate dehydratase
MSKKKVNEFLEEDEIVEEKNHDEDFKVNAENLEIDIQNIDTRLRNLNIHIGNIETNLQQLNNLLKNETDIKKKIDMNKQISYYLELIAKLEEVYQKYLTVKFNYRKEQDSLLINKIRVLEVDLRKIEKDAESLSASGLMNIFKTFINHGDNTILQKVEDQLEDDPDYHN